MKIWFKNMWGPPPPKEIQGPKTCKIWCIFGRLTVSSEGMKVFEIRQLLDRLCFFPRSTKKFGQHWSSN